MQRTPRLSRNSQSSLSIDDVMSLPGVSNVAEFPLSESAVVCTTASPVSTPQIVVSSIVTASSGPPPQLAASSVVVSPIFPSRMAAPSMSTMPPFGQLASSPLNFPFQPTVGSPVSPGMGPSFSATSRPSWPPIASVQDPRLASFPRAQGSHPSGTPFLFSSQYPVPGPSGSIPESTFPRSVFLGPRNSCASFFSR